MKLRFRFCKIDFNFFWGSLLTPGRKVENGGGSLRELRTSTLQGRTIHVDIVLLETNSLLGSQLFKYVYVQKLLQVSF